MNQHSFIISSFVSKHFSYSQLSEQTSAERIFLPTAFSLPYLISLTSVLLREKRKHLLGNHLKSLLPADTFSTNTYFQGYRGTGRQGRRLHPPKQLRCENPRLSVDRTRSLGEAELIMSQTARHHGDAASGTSCFFTRLSIYFQPPFAQWNQPCSVTNFLFLFYVTSLFCVFYINNNNKKCCFIKYIQPVVKGKLNSEANISRSSKEIATCHSKCIELRSLWSWSCET